MAKRSKTHVLVGVGFVLASILVAAAVYTGIKFGLGVHANTSASTETGAENAVEENPAPTAPASDVAKPSRAASEPVESEDGQMGGLYAESVDDGGNCHGELWVFGADGSYSHTLDHQTFMTGVWRLSGLSLRLTDNVLRDADRNIVGNADDETVRFQASEEGLNVGGQQFVACQGA